MSRARDGVRAILPIVTRLASGALLGDGPYVLEELMSAQGRSTVWRARHEVTEAPVVVKLLPAAAASPGGAAYREARALVRLDHPNVARLIEAHVDASPPYLVTERVEGPTLAQFLGELHLMERRLSVSQAAQILVQIGEACLHAHAKGVIHRDLKPQNILVTQAGASIGIKVIDFGVARLLDERDRDQETTVGRVYGTLYYMAPEQIHGRAWTPKVDAFALAVVGFEILTGYRCFVREEGHPMLAFTRPIPSAENGKFETFRRIVRQARTPLRSLRPSLPEELEEAILNGLEVDPAQRTDVETLIRPFRAFTGQQGQGLSRLSQSDLERLTSDLLEEPGGDYTPLPLLEGASPSDAARLRSETAPYPIPREGPLARAAYLPTFVFAFLLGATLLVVLLEVWS